MRSFVTHSLKLSAQPSYLTKNFSPSRLTTVDGHHFAPHCVSTFVPTSIPPAGAGAAGVAAGVAPAAGAAGAAGAAAGAAGAGGGRVGAVRGEKGHQSRDEDADHENSSG